MDSFKDMTIEEYSRVLASKDAVPGGGGTAALVAALAISLGGMVTSLTIGKKKYKDYEQDLIRLQKKCEDLRTTFLELIDQDAVAFEPLSKAYSLPKDTAEEQNYRNVIMEAALKEAAGVPLEIMRTCADSVALLQEIGEKGSRLAVSDAGCAAALIEGAMKSAALNVIINTKMMKNRDIAREMNSEVLDILTRYGQASDYLYQQVYEELLNS